MKKSTLIPLALLKGQFNSLIPFLGLLVDQTKCLTHAKHSLFHLPTSTTQNIDPKHQTFKVFENLITGGLEKQILKKKKKFFSYLEYLKVHVYLSDYFIIWYVAY